MTGLWEALSDPETREILAWIGGGICVVATGLWAAYLKLGVKPPPVPPPPTAPTVTADRGGIAAGRDVNIPAPPGRARKP